VRQNEGGYVEKVIVRRVVVVDGVEKWDWMILEGSRSVGDATESDNLGEFIE